MSSCVCVCVGLLGVLGAAHVYMLVCVCARVDFGPSAVDVRAWSVRDVHVNSS